MNDETKHSPEPWRATWENESYVEVQSGPTAVARAVFGGLFGDKQPAHANARRIVACVNACAGIPTEALEAGALASLIVNAVDILQHTGSECDLEACPTASGLIAALRSLGRLP